METFDDLGIPFPLFRGPAAHACTDPAGNCNVCGVSAPIRFFEACYNCLRAGKVNNTLDTELGMIRVEDAEKGLTHGLPLSNPPVVGEYELVPHPVDPNLPDQNWFHIRIDSEYLLELLRSPIYHTWQGDNWQFCCQRPCAFLGSLPAGALSNTDSIANWFRSPDWVAVRNRDFGSLTYYVFQCVTCGAFRHHEDCD